MKPLCAGSKVTLTGAMLITPSPTLRREHGRDPVELFGERRNRSLRLRHGVARTLLVGTRNEISEPTMRRRLSDRLRRNCGILKRKNVHEFHHLTCENDAV